MVAILHRPRCDNPADSAMAGDYIGLRQNYNYDYIYILLSETA